MYYTMRGTLDILPMGIYLNDNSMANILYLKEVGDSLRVNMEYFTLADIKGADIACDL